MMAMIKLWESEKLKRLGWKLILQIHDEVIMEGPKESKDEVGQKRGRSSYAYHSPNCCCLWLCALQAMKEVMQCMENPFDDFALSRLSVHLDVDAKSADSWYKAK
jgi:DNA polymerase I